MSVAGSPIEAVLTLNATSFHTGLTNVSTRVKTFVNTMNSMEKDTRGFTATITQLMESIEEVFPALERFSGIAKEVDSFKKFAKGVEALATSVRVLGDLSDDTRIGMTRVMEVIKSLEGVLQPTKVQITGVASALRELRAMENQEADASKRSNSIENERINTLRRLQNELNIVASSVEKFNAIDSTSNSVKNLQSQMKTLESEFNSAEQWMLRFANTGVEAFNRIGRTVSSVATQTNTLRLSNTFNNPLDSGDRFAKQTALIEQNSLAMRENGAEKLRNMGYTGKLSIEEEKASVSTEKHTQSAQRNINAMNRQASASRGLGRALSNLRMMGTMVASMFAYNFAHNLLMATSETVHAKSEMEGYFKMLNFSQGQVDQFNKKLNETVGQFQRINKYSLGETISSIGVEFELTTEEMEKAMPVVSMITSEYLRAGRNANEASLAVKDILQGEFQRLSRETGVKGDQLKEAGWSGDKNDVMGLLEALDKVGKSRNWDVFVTKANSLNDIITILQNRFGEWSADMVNVVQPAIVNAFNSILSFGQGMATGLSGAWEWLNGDGWGQTATKIGMVGTALLTVSQALVQYRTGMGLAQTSQLGVTKQLASLVLGLKGQEIAEVGVRNAILSKIMGLKAETIAEKGMSFAIKESTLMTKLATVEEKMNTMALGENNVASKMQTIQAKLNKLAKEGVLTATEKDTIAEELNTIAKENSTLATIEQEGANTGLIASLYALGTGEVYVAGETGALATAMGILNGVFALSPIGWLTGLVLGLAGAFYVLTGGLNDTWGKMQTFNDNVEKGNDALKPYWQNVDQTWQELEKAKKEHGENSEEVKKLTDKLHNAKDSFDNFREALQKGVKVSQELNDELELLEPHLDAITRENYGSLGKSNEELDEISNTMNAMGYGTDQYYRALQSLVKMEDTFKETQKDTIPVLTGHGRQLDENARNLGNYNKNMKEYMEHSTNANTAEDWWTWSWESYWASTSREQADAGVVFAGMENTIRDLPKTLTDWINNATSGNFLSDEGAKIWKNIAKQLGDGFSSVMGDFSKWLGDSSGQLSNLPQQFMDAIGNIDWGVDDILSKLPKIDFGEWLNAILPDPVSAEDGSDHPPVLDEMYQVIVQPIVDWINNFNADPLGTLSSFGVVMPQLNIVGMIKSLLSMGSEDGGTFDIGSWISSMFNIDGIISYFTTNLPTIVSSVTNTVNTVSGMFNNLKTNIQTHLTNIVTNVTNGFNTVKDNAVSKITAMKDSVKGVIDQMVGAWNTMKDSILNSAKKIQDGVKEKFDQVKSTIGGFYHKLTNPSEWFSGGGQKSWSSSPKPHTARKLFGVRSNGKHGAGSPDPYKRSGQTVTLDELVAQLGGNKRVNLGEFLSLFAGSGFGGWDFAKKHKDTIFNEGKKWKADSPSMNGVTLGDGFPVLRFWNGKASGFTWDEFMSVASAIFSAIPYKFYMDSDWKGNWVSALLSGAMNCSDGADALIALASLFGFSGEKIHTNLKDGTGHFYTRINGHTMDTTNFQKSGSWSPLGGAGSPPRGYSQGKTVNINVEITGTVYGVEDLDSRIQESVEKGLKAEFNDPYTIAI